MNRQELAVSILQRLNQERAAITRSFASSRNQIGYFIVDNLLPEKIAQDIYGAFPEPGSMKTRRSLRELKYVAAQMDKYNSILEETVYAFQDVGVVNAVRKVCDIDTLYPDEYLYAGGISLMGKDHFLNPHLDNSHEKDRIRWRVLNLLYYVTPEWDPGYGGNLEIWPNGVKDKQITIDNIFNRLVVMATHGSSWHSVSPISTDRSRTCVSNYYFSDTALKTEDVFHVTSFRGRPEQKIRDWVLRADTAVRQGIRALFPKGAVKTDHVYKKPEDL